MSKYRNYNKNRNVAAGIGAGGGIIYIIVHVLHVAHGFNSLHDLQQQEENPFKNAPVTIVLTDSVTGKKDTVALEKYLRHLDSNAIKK